jgi:hypothetical protein
MNSDWAQRRFTFNDLKQFAAVRGNMERAVDFLKAAQVIPYDVVHISAPDYVNTNLNPDAIPAGYLAALAYEWDKDGPIDDSALEFVESLRPELRGFPEREAVREAVEAGDFES